jgi:hypothetical protein
MAGCPGTAVGLLEPALATLVDRLRPDLESVGLPATGGAGVLGQAALRWARLAHFCIGSRGGLPAVVLDGGNAELPAAACAFQRGLGAQHAGGGDRSGPGAGSPCGGCGSAVASLARPLVCAAKRGWVGAAAVVAGGPVVSDPSRSGPGAGAGPRAGLPGGIAAGLFFGRGSAERVGDRVAPGVAFARDRVAGRGPRFAGAVPRCVRGGAAGLAPPGSGGGCGGRGLCRHHPVHGFELPWALPPPPCPRL